MAGKNTPTPAKRKMPYGTARWQRKRKECLETARYLCAMCKKDGRYTPATVADHIEPHRGDLDKFWHGELQALCAHHHNSDKQRIERGGKVKQRFSPDGWPEE